MLVQLTTGEKLSGYKKFEDIFTFSKTVEDNEATEIICDNFLSSFYYGDVKRVIDVIVKKMRLNCKLTICEQDFYLISRHVYKQLHNIENINEHVFNKKEEISLKSLLTSEFVESILQDYNLSMISKGLESTRFILKLERVQ